LSSAAAVLESDAQRVHSEFEKLLEADIAVLIHYGLVTPADETSEGAADADSFPWVSKVVEAGPVDARNRLHGRYLQFSAGLVRDVVYNQMLYAQRRRLHRAAAELTEGVLNQEPPQWVGAPNPQTPYRFSPIRPLPML